MPMLTVVPGRWFLISVIAPAGSTPASEAPSIVTTRSPGLMPWVAAEPPRDREVGPARFELRNELARGFATTSNVTSRMQALDAH